MLLPDDVRQPRRGVLEAGTSREASFDGMRARFLGGGARGVSSLSACDDPVASGDGVGMPMDGRELSGRRNSRVLLVTVRPSG